MGDGVIFLQPNYYGIIYFTIVYCLHTLRLLNKWPFGMKFMIQAFGEVHKCHTFDHGC